MAESMKRRWCLTINNEERSLEELSEYIQNLEHFKYAIFQREKGEKTETPHIQMFIIFTCGKRFSTIQNYFPRAHIEDAKGTNTQCRDYCSKSETRIEGPVELGAFAEERARTDISNFMELVKLGTDYSDLEKLYPKLYLDNISKLDKIKENARLEKFSKILRDIEVTYIYGEPGIGKTSYIVNKYELGTFYSVPFYKYGNFDNYNGEDIIVFDEFASQVDITLMNKLIDRYPMQLPSRYASKVACYTKVYIISNLPLSSLYPNDRESGLYNAFLRRIHTVIKFDKKGMHYEKRTINKQVITKIEEKGDEPL